MNYSNDKLTTVKAFQEGYGEFPYIIVRLFSAVYMQIPLQINSGYDPDLFPGSQINGIADSLLEEYRFDKYSKLHTILISRARMIKETLEEEYQRPILLCLVEEKDMAHYFEGEKIEFSTVIPWGGSLVTHSKKVIAMNAAHYKDSDE
ncbi:hypothetical protein E4S40_02350 [Algoriphagus kandeliae]|uniref:Uncharacterized protein n=1 Tax=Algoriphagus kandeliae TaxID=2562278 RepID=A0A4Y9QZE7_9BACT|nr:hypothetical protein [Algoriphagus kandeliae]TFV97517.1 hypothetical protein E4S40_02350 [Algoriphagus kandeliae]